MSPLALRFLGFSLGVAAWVAAMLYRPGATPLDSGWVFLFALVVAGFMIGLFEGALSWQTLLAFYAGQVVGLFVQVTFGDLPPDATPLPLQALFLLPANLTAVASGVGGAWVRSVVSYEQVKKRLSKWLAR